MITLKDLAHMLKHTGPPCDKWDIEFQGEKYIFIGERDVDGAIATPYQFENFLDSYAHLFKDGIIRRYQQNIGTKEDITYIRKVSR